MNLLSQPALLATWHLDDKTCETIAGGRQQRGLAGKRMRSEGGQRTRISGGFYQINIAMNFIVGGNGNTITTMQGNDIGSLSFKAIGLPTS